MGTILPPTYARLTVTRFVAALFVVIFHYGQTTWPFSSSIAKPIIGWGQVSVSYFFCLSGFIITAVYSNSDRLSVFKFFTARVSRIAPGYYSALLIVSLLSSPSLTEVFPHLLMVQPWFPSRVMDINPPAWSVGVEIFFYALFPLIFVLMTRCRTRSFLKFSIFLWVATVIVHLALFTFYSNTKQLASGLRLLEYHPIMHVNEFIMGCAGGLWSIRNRFVKSYWFDLLGSATALAIFSTLMLSGHLLPAAALQSTLLTGLLAPLMVVFLISLPRMRMALWDIMRWRPLCILGEASYALYIFQHPVLLALHNTVFYWVIAVDLQFYYYLVFLMLFSVSFFALIEEPFRDFIRQTTRFASEALPSIVSKRRIDTAGG